MTSFDTFGLAEPILRALAAENYTQPTPIQAQTIPHAITGRDVVGIAQTGTGKTAAFALPVLNQLAAKRAPLAKKTCRVLVLSPTRELSGQILDSFRTYGKHLRISTALAIGGVSMGGQVRALLNGVEVLVATPGRLLDLVQSNAVRLNAVEHLVLDEADRMLDMGFIHDIRKIVAKLPKERQTLFFSATMPQAIAELAAQMLHDPVKVAVTPVSSTAERVAQQIIHVEKAAKPALLADVIKREAIDRALVFARTKHGADKIVRALGQANIRSEAIHGNKSQNNRDRTLKAFRDGQIRILVATDIAARGIDVDGVSHVINYDLPNVPETYVHRIGRTARAGADGVAISFCDGEEFPYLRGIERLIKQEIPSTGTPIRGGAPAPRQQGHGHGQGGRGHGGGGRAHGGGGRPGSNGHHQSAGGRSGASGNRSHGSGGHPQRGERRDGGGQDRAGSHGRPQQRRGHGGGAEQRTGGHSYIADTRPVSFRP